jgi:hypothetical protein
MRDIQPLGIYADVIQAPSPFDPNNTVKLGIRSDTLKSYISHQLATSIAQYYGLVQDGLRNARHAFRGLKRPLLLGDDAKADQSVVVYTWRSRVDYPDTLTALVGRVFVVLVREEEPNDHEITGAVEHWNWVREDRALPHAPVDWESRYDKKLWSRGF